MDQEQPIPAAVVRPGNAVASGPPPVPGQRGETAVERLVPYRNLPALIGYYLGVFSLIPFIGIPLGMAAIPLGIIGLVKRRRMPAVHGTAHAIVAIILGLFSVVIYSGLTALFFVGLILP